MPAASCSGWEGMTCCQVSAALPSLVLSSCFPLALHFWAWIHLLWFSPWWVFRSSDTRRELLPPTIYLTSLVMLPVTPIMEFILPFQSPLLFQVSAVVSLDSGCQTLANFVFLVMASHYQCCAWSQVPFTPQICKLSKRSKSLGQTLTAPVSIKD